MTPAEVAGRMARAGVPLDEDHVATLIRLGRTDVLAAGDVLLEEGRPSDTLYIVDVGQLAVRARNGIELARVGDGMLVGEVSFLDAGPASATVVASTPATLLAIDRAVFGAVRDRAPATATALIRVLSLALAARIRRSSDMLEVLVGPSAREAPDRTWLEALRALFSWGPS